MKIAVFCGSSAGNDSIYAEAAQTLGQALVRHGHSLVYGGGKVGLMGILADAVIAEGGHVTGVIPQLLQDREIAHDALSDLVVVDDMHQRKSHMASLADAFIAMPGGPGTLEEIFEVWTWAQLGYHEKPCAFLNTNGYFNSLFLFFDQMCDNGFLKGPYRDMLVVDDQPDTVLHQLTGYQPPQSKW